MVGYNQIQVSPYRSASAGLSQTWRVIPMNNEQEIRAKALELSAQIIGKSPLIGFEPTNPLQEKKITEDSIKRYLEVALLIETHIRKVDQL